MSQGSNEESSELIENYKASEESDNLYEDWLKSSPNQSPDRPCSIQTIVIKSVAQSYQEMFTNIYLEPDFDCRDKLKPLESSQSSQVQSTTISFASPKENTGSILEYKDLSRTFYGSIVEQAQESEIDEDLNQIFCGNCKKMVSSRVSLQLKQMNWWYSVQYLIDSFRCCGNSEDIKKYHEYAYSCLLCGNIIALKPVILK